MAYYFVSDVHLGLSYRESDPRERERRFVAWLDAIRPDCEGLFLLGDIFDFWFEYRRVVPKGFVRVLGKLAELCDAGIPVWFFAGNHDMWIGDYFGQEIGMTVYTEPQTFTLQGKTLFLAHGDGLGKTDDRKYAVLRRIFHSRTLRRIFSAGIHPNGFLRFGHWWSSHNRHVREDVAHEFRDEEEPLTLFSREYVAAHPETDYLVFGHIHTPVSYSLDHKATMVILGHWVDNNPAVFGRLDNGMLELFTFEEEGISGENN